MTPVRKESPMRSRLGGVALVVLWILCVGCNPSARVIGDDLRCAPIHPHPINVSSDDLSVEPGKRSWEIFQNHPEWLHDRIHPNAIGIGVYRQHYAALLCAEVYQTVC